MADDETVHGVVVGAPGEVVAGYAHLGPKGTRRPIGGALRIRTDDGREVELVDLPAAKLAPVVRTKGAWQEIDGAEGAQACLADAPAPDVTVELFAALVRGDDRIAAAGVVRETQLAPSTEGDAFRTAPAALVAKLAPRVIFVGVDADRRLAEAQREESEARADRAREDAEAAERAGRIAAEPRAPVPPVGPPPPAGHWVVRATIAWMVVMLGLVALGLRATPIARHAWLVVIALLGLLPLLFHQADAPPVFRKTTRKGNAWIVGTLVVDATLAAIFAVVQAQTMHGRHARRLANEGRPPDLGMLWVSVVLSMITIAMIVWLLARRRAEAQFLRRIRTARTHAAAPVDGAWGALEGTIDATDPVTIGGHAAVLAAGEETRYRGSGKNASSSSTPVSEINRDAWVTSEHGKLALPVGEATWMSLEFFATAGEAPAGSQMSIVSGRLLRPAQPVRVVGRTRHGAYVKGGQDSLLVFGGKMDRAMAPSLASLVARARSAELAALLGAAAALAAIVLAFAG